MPLYRYKGDAIRISTGMKTPFEDFTTAPDKNTAMRYLQRKNPELDLLAPNLYEVENEYQELSNFDAELDKETKWGYDTCPHCNSKLDSEMLCPKCDLGKL